MLLIVNKIFLLGVLLVFFILLSIAAYKFDNYITFSWEARIRWGYSPFDPKTFREVSTNKKARMIADLLRKDYLLGQTVKEVKKNLGEKTGGYYNTESNLPYTVYEKDKTVWDLIFIVNHETQRIDYIFVYRQGDGITRTILFTFGRIVEELFDKVFYR